MQTYVPLHVTHANMTPHGHINAGMVNMPCPSAGSQSLKVSQTHCLLKIQLRSAESRGDDRTQKQACKAEYEREREQKRMDDLTPRFDTKGGSSRAQNCGVTFMCPGAFFPCAEQITM